MSKYTAQFHYGCNYAAPQGDDVEHFDSLAAIGREVERRADDTFYPDAEPEALVWNGHESDVTDMYPDRHITLGPRGGLHCERC